MSKIENSPRLFYSVLALVLLTHLVVGMGHFWLPKKIHFSKNRSEQTSIRVELQEDVPQVVKVVKRVKAPSKKVIHKKIVHKKVQRPVVKKDRGQQNLLAKYLTKVRNKINNNKYYPRLAKKLHQQGVVKVKLKIAADGKIIFHKLLKDSKHRLLNRATMATLKKIEKFDPFPQKLDEKSLELVVPVVYEII